MNTIWKIICRTYQFAFHMALPLLPYREPKIYESITDLRLLLKERRIKSVLLVTDSTLRSAGITKPLDQLKGLLKVLRKIPMLMNAKELEKFYYEVADWS